MERGVIGSFDRARVMANCRLRVAEVPMEVAEVVMSFGESGIEFDRSQEAVFGRLKTKCCDVGDSEVVVSARASGNKAGRACQE